MSSKRTSCRRRQQLKQRQVRAETRRAERSGDPAAREGLQAALGLAESLGADQIYPDCPACGAKNAPMKSLAAFLPYDTERSGPPVVYGLCSQCTNEMGKADEDGRRRIAAKVEFTLGKYPVVAGTH